MLTYIANFFTKKYIAIIKDIIDKYPEIQGLATRSQIGEFIFTKKFLFLIDAVFSMQLVNIHTDVFNEIVFNPGYDTDNYKIIKKINPEAENILNELEESIKEFNKENGFEFFEVVLEKHLISDCGLYLSANLSDLEKYFKRYDQRV